MLKKDSVEVTVTTAMMNMVVVTRREEDLICGCKPHNCENQRRGKGVLLATWLRHSFTTERPSFGSVLLKDFSRKCCCSLESSHTTGKFFVRALL